jgi:hypothetical protein
MAERNRGQTPPQRNKSSIEDNEMAERSDKKIGIRFIDADETGADFDFGNFCMLLDKESIAFSLPGDRTVLLDQEVYNTLPESINVQLAQLGENKVESRPIAITGRRRIPSREEAKKRALSAIGNRPTYTRRRK